MDLVYLTLAAAVFLGNSVVVLASGLRRDPASQC